MTDLVWIASSSALILIVIAVRAIFGKKMSAGLRYALWALVLVRLLIPGTVFQSPVSVKSAVSASGVVRDLETVEGIRNVSRSDTGLVTGVRRSQLPSRPASTESPANDTAVISSVVVEQNASPERFERIKKTIEIRDALNIVWYAGMGVTAAYIIFVNARFYIKLRKRREPIGSDAPCRVYAVKGLDSSCLFMNAIYVSNETAEDESTLRFVLAHELAHRRHFDAVFALLRSAALILHWYNPLVWAAAVLSRRDGELFADAGAVSSLGESERENYGRTLISLAAGKSARANIACAATAMTNGKRELKARITHVAKRRRTGVLIAAAVVLTALLAASCSFLGGKKPASTPAPTAAPTVAPPDHHMTPDPTDPIVTPTPMPNERIPLGGYSELVPVENRLIVDDDVGVFMLTPDGLLFAIEAENKDGLVTGANTVTETVNGREIEFFRAETDSGNGREPYLLDRDVVDAVTLFIAVDESEYYGQYLHALSCSGNGNKYDGEYYHSLIYMKSDGSVWLRGSDPFGMFGAHPCGNDFGGQPVKIFDHALGISAFKGSFGLVNGAIELCEFRNGSPEFVAGNVDPEHFMGTEAYLTLDGDLYVKDPSTAGAYTRIAQNVNDFDGFAGGTAEWYVHTKYGYVDRYSLNADLAYEKQQVMRDAASIALDPEGNGLAALDASGSLVFTQAWGTMPENVKSCGIRNGMVWAVTGDGKLFAGVIGEGVELINNHAAYAAFMRDADGHYRLYFITVYDFGGNGLGLWMGMNPDMDSPGGPYFYDYVLFRDPLMNLPPPIIGEEPTADSRYLVPDGNGLIDCDLDFDGLPDTVLVTGGGESFTVTVTLGADPSESFYFEQPNNVYQYGVHVVDCDITDERLEIVVDFLTEDDGEYLAVLRVRRGGSGIDCFMPEVQTVLNTRDDGYFDPSWGIPVKMRTEIFGTSYLVSCLTVTDDGLYLTQPLFNPTIAMDYLPNHTIYTLKRELAGFRVNDDGSIGEAYTVPAGARVELDITDGRSWIWAIVYEGGIGAIYVDIEVRYGYIVLINGVPQDEYFDVQYAD
ncbi:MAG: M56 family metallopeptidase [Clostridiales bacterium]|nr:M56 family metallopeptidase [Clostridiales bacterium]